MAKKSEKSKKIEDSSSQNDNIHILEVALLQRQLRRLEKANKGLEEALMDKEADLIRAETLLAQQLKSNAIWGLGDED